MFSVAEGDKITLIGGEEREYRITDVNGFIDESLLPNACYGKAGTVFLDKVHFK